MIRPRVIGCLLALLCSALGSPSPAQRGGRLPAQRQALLLLKVLSYDRKLSQRAGGSLRIAIVHKQRSRPSRQQARALLDALASLESLTVQKMSISAALVQYTDVSSLEGQLEATRSNTIYVAPGLDEELRQILSLAAARKLNVITGVRAYVAQGVTVGAVLEGNRPKILLNLKAAFRHGNDFSSQLFKVAELVDEG